MDKDSKRALRQKSASFAVEGGILMHKLGDKLCRVVMDVAERDRIVASLHADPIGGAHYRSNRDDSQSHRSCVVMLETNIIIRFTQEYAIKTTQN